MGLREDLNEMYWRAPLNSVSAYGVGLRDGARIALGSLPCCCTDTGIGDGAGLLRCGRCRALSELTEGK